MTATEPVKLVYLARMVKSCCREFLQQEEDGGGIEEPNKSTTLYRLERV